jgi:hypothetical protein
VLGETLRCLLPHAISLIAKFFSLFWDTATLPGDLKTSLTTLLHKKGDLRVVANYRPIALADALAKDYTKAITEILSSFAEEEGILSESQQGFRPMRGVTDAIRMATSAIEDAHLAHQDLHITYVDFSRAFNTVPHDGLKRVLTLLGFPERRRSGGLLYL